jgi:anti-anti-sigma regulatory factor
MLRDIAPRAQGHERVLRLADELTLRTAPGLCRALEAAFDAGDSAVTLDLGHVKTSDVVGLATLVQAARRCTALGVALSVVPSASLQAALFRAQALDEIPLVTAVPESPMLTLEAVDVDAASPAPFVAHTRRVGLRPPTWDELPSFQTWAEDPFLDQMVGSDLLYRCRHLGPYHPEFVSAVLYDPCALTLIVEPLAPLQRPVGFVRCHAVHLGQQFGFLETAVATLESLRRGWGIEASRLMVALARDVLALQRVEAKVYAYNVLSANALRRNGFTQEGVLREARVYNGQRWDIQVFSLVESEMRAHRHREAFPYIGFWRTAP